MEFMKVTLITTVLNEEKTIASFLTSIKNQNQKPDEVVIVDGGSSDNTLSIISNFKLPFKIKILEKKGNRSVGRNFAIKNSTHEIIAVTDAGCILDKNWLKEIVKPFKESRSIDVVSGFYNPVFKNIFEKGLSTYTCVMEDKIDKNNFLPSSRSVALKKSVFLKVGGYPEYLNTCEDLLFDQKLKKIGAKFEFNKNALVYWPQRKNILQAAKQFFSYAYGDGRALYFRKTASLLLVRYLIGLIVLFSAIYFKSNVLWILLLFALFFYLLWSIWKNYKYVRSWKAFFFSPLLQLISDVAVISGVICGLISRINLLRM